MGKRRQAMRVIATVSKGGTGEIRIEGESPFLDGNAGDSLEEKNLGFWLTNCRFVDSKRKRLREQRVFIPWASLLYMEEKMAMTEISL
jgi:hypothetical protein